MPSDDPGRPRPHIRWVFGTWTQYPSYWHAHGVPAYAQASARHGLIREHAGRGRAEISAAEPEYGDLEPGQ